MTLLSGIRSGLRSGVRSGLNADSGAMSAVSRDATSNVYAPETIPEWTAALGVAGIATGTPSNLYLLQEASGNAADAIGSKTLTAAGTLSYQQSVSGWSRKSIRTATGVAGTLKNTTFGNVNATSHLLLLYALNGTVASTRTVARMGDVFDDDATIEVTSTPRVQVGEGDASRSVGTASPVGAVRPYVLRINDTSNLVDAFTDQEKIVGGAQACNGTELCIGGDNGQTWMPNDCDYLYCAVFSGAAAELSDDDVRSLLQTLGWTVLW